MYRIVLRPPTVSPFSTMNIRLIEPEDDTFTVPLQRQIWPPENLEDSTETVDAGAYHWSVLHMLTDDRSLPAPVVFTWGLPRTTMPRSSMF